MYQLIYVDFYGRTNNLVFGTMNSLKDYLDDNGITSGEKKIQSFKVTYLTDEEFNKLADEK